MLPSQEIRFCKSSDDVELAMALYGAGPPLVKVATWLTHVEQDRASPFDRQLIDEIAPHFRYVTYDARGCGLSQRKVGEISQDAWVRDLETVVDALELDTFPLLGFSNGASVAVAYAAKHPERVSQLILFGGFTTSYFSSSNADAKVLEEGETLIKLVELGWGSDRPEFRQVFVSRFLPDATAEQWRQFDELQRDTATPDVAARCVRAMYNINIRDLAPQVRCPALVLHVKDDQLVYFERGRRLAASIKGARFVPLEGRNHIPFVNEPAWEGFVHELRGFLGVSDAKSVAGSQTKTLTKRQLEVLERVAAGATDKQVARELSLSSRTVEMHVSAALQSLGAKTRAEAVKKATEQGYFQPR